MDWVTKFVSTVGLPGGALLLLIIGALKHFPKLLEIFERMTTGIERMGDVTKETREDVRDIKTAILSRDS
jgi:hypothetical protein